MTNSSMSSSLPAGTEASLFETFSSADFQYPESDMSRLAAINPYFMNYNQQQLPSAFNNKVLSGHNQQSVSQFVPTNSLHEVPVSDTKGLINQQQGSQAPQPVQASADVYEVPKHVLHVGHEKPMAREDRVARYAASCSISKTIWQVCKALSLLRIFS